MKSNGLRYISRNFAEIMQQDSEVITAKELAKSSGISYPTLNRILKGESDFGVLKLIAFAKALNVTPNDLLQGTYKEVNRKIIKASKPPKYLISFSTSAELTRCNVYNTHTKENKDKLFPFTLACTTNAAETISIINTAIYDMCGKDIDSDEIYVYASVLGYEHIIGRSKLSELASREYAQFIMEPDWKLAHNSIFQNTKGIMITINDGFVISYNDKKNKEIKKVQGYIPTSAEAGNMWLGSEACKHAINVKEGVEERTLLSDKILGFVFSDLEMLATKICDAPRETYTKASVIVRQIASHDKKSTSLIKHSFENIWKRIKVIDNQIGEELPICLAGDLADLYEKFIPKARLFKNNVADNDIASINYANNLLLSLVKND